MAHLMSRDKLLAAVTRMSDKTLLQSETKLQNRIAGLQKCVPWPALIHSVAGDLEIIWAEQHRRQLAKEKLYTQQTGFFFDSMTAQKQHDKR